MFANVYHARHAIPRKKWSRQRKLLVALFTLVALFIILGTTGAKADTVRPGDTLSGIAAKHHVSLAALEGVNPQFAANWDLILVGQHVNIPGNKNVGVTASGGSWGHPFKCGDGDGDGWDLACSKLHGGGGGGNTAPTSSSSGGSFSSGDLASVPGVPRSFAACVAFRESSNNPHAVGPLSGGGAYGFLQSTWSSLGYPGSPQTASVAMQKAAFSKLYAQMGTQPWSPSDGC